MLKAEEVVEIFTDGACSGNPGEGGYAALLRYKGKEKEISGGEKQTTNNRMEMMAVISALKALKKPCQVKLYTDSKYVLNGIREWLKSWKSNGWKTSSKKEVLNIDLWQEIDSLLTIHSVEAEWVKGHSGHSENERVDKLACMEVEKQKSL